MLVDPQVMQGLGTSRSDIVLQFDLELTELGVRHTREARIERQRNFVGAGTLAADSHDKGGDSFGFLLFRGQRHDWTTIRWLREPSDQVCNQEREKR